MSELPHWLFYFNILWLLVNKALLAYKCCYFQTEAELVSVDFLPEGVSDIDEGEDRDNPQSAAEYVNHIYAYLRQLEEKYAVQKVIEVSFMTKISYIPF